MHIVGLHKIKVYNMITVVNDNTNAIGAYKNKLKKTMIFIKELKRLKHNWEAVSVLTKFIIN